MPGNNNFDWGGFLRALAGGAASGSQANNAWQGIALGGAGGFGAYDDYLRQNSRMDLDQAYINNLIQDNMRSQDYYNLQKDQFDWQKQKYNESQPFPEDIRLEKEKRRLDISGKRATLAETRKRTQLMGREKPGNELEKARKEYDDIQQEMVKLTSLTDYLNNSPEKQKRLQYLNMRSKDLEKNLNLAAPLAMDSGTKEIIDTGTQQVFPKNIPQQGTATQNRQIDEGIARQILQQAGGDKNKAREIAKQRGYNF